MVYRGTVEHFGANPSDRAARARRGRLRLPDALRRLCSPVIPQFKAVYELFASQGVLVVGLHTIFEHHEAMTTTSLRAFLHENPIRFPVGVDSPPEDRGAVPMTMQAYQMQGTLMLLVIEHAGRLCRRSFCHVPDLELAAEIASIIAKQR